MKQRRFFKKLHLICALLAALPLFTAGLSGTILVFFKPVEHLSNQGHWDIEPAATALPLTDLLAFISQEHPELKWSGIGIPKTPDRALQFFGSNAAEDDWVVYVDPFRRTITAAFSREQLSTFTALRWLTEFHRSLQAGTWGSRIVGFSTIILILSLLSGFYLWLPKSWKNLRSKLKPRNAHRWKQKAFNWHNFMGFYLGTGLFIVAASGMIMAFHEQLDPFIYGITRTEKPQRLVPFPYDPGKPSLNPDQILQKSKDIMAARFRSRAWPEYISLPSDKSAVTRVYFQEADDLYDLTLYELALHAQDGNLLRLSAPSTRNAGQRFLNWVAVLHFGTWGDTGGQVLGWAGRLLWVLLAATLPFLVLSGLTIWKKPAYLRRRD